MATKLCILDIIHGISTLIGVITLGVRRELMWPSKCSISIGHCILMRAFDKPTLAPKVKIGARPHGDEKKQHEISNAAVPRGASENQYCQLPHYEKQDQPP